MIVELWKYEKTGGWTMSAELEFFEAMEQCGIPFAAAAWDRDCSDIDIAAAMRRVGIQSYIVKIMPSVISPFVATRAFVGVPSRLAPSGIIGNRALIASYCHDHERWHTKPGRLLWGRGRCGCDS